MQTILVPVDFSPVSRNAAIYAAELARFFQARLLLFHAYMLPTPVSEVPYVMVTADEMQQENEAFLKKEAQNLHSTYGVEVESLVRIGIASDEIRELAKEESVDLVVMGMKGAGGLDKIIGSTTTNVIRKLKTPVLIIPHDAGYKQVQHITYASDFSYKTSSNLFAPLLEIAKTLGAKIHILHVQKDAVKIDELAGRKSTERAFSGYDHEFVNVTDNSVTHGINDYLQHHASELLVMVAHTHTFFERIFSKSRTTAMCYETKIPLLVLQDKG
ncbi:universal stress protein [Pseudoflavitalea sp. X16]|uniref:universal stress protein n=1 Tax=Paraflavitalea devenefica TaxID=2716334 RepID=UPI0014215AC2|nr:universal stress protein [Paraflavitalea devenefica]NII23744.1 universal stress protein [Paraflavitalea devenefica]